MARSGVFEAATVMVSSDWTAVLGTWARASINGPASAGTGFGFAGLRLDCFCRSDDALTASVPAVCAKPKSEKPNAVEITDAPTIKARERLAPSAIITHP